MHVQLEWDGNIEPDLAGYKLYVRGPGGEYTFGEGYEYETIPPEHTMAIIILPDGSWRMVLTAFDTEGLESDPSNEVEIIQSPQNIRIE